MNRLENTKNDFHLEASEEATPQSFRRFSLDQVAAMGMEIPSGVQDFQVFGGNWECIGLHSQKDKWIVD